jgi:uncharacterized protein YdhG (YjbR/CyaY superfamily)
VTPVEDYLTTVPEPGRSTLAELRQAVLAVVPDAEEGISYGMPAFRLHGKVVAGFAAFKNHLSYLPHSGSVLPELADELTGFTTTKGSLHFAPDQPLDPDLVRRLVTVRLAEIG